jgi:uncharacterized membrane protein YeaQ/YmgE (transglycosylase-associated protein family)
VGREVLSGIFEEVLVGIAGAIIQDAALGMHDEAEGFGLGARAIWIPSTGSGQAPYWYIPA